MDEEHNIVVRIRLCGGNKERRRHELLAASHCIRSSDGWNLMTTGTTFAELNETPLNRAIWRTMSHEVTELVRNLMGTDDDATSDAFTILRTFDMTPISSRVGGARVTALRSRAELRRAGRMTINQTNRAMATKTTITMTLTTGATQVLG